jgi:hypothetical protein
VTQNNKQSNELIHESSPYLLQHAYNPVQWLPFGDAAFRKAKELNLPVLVSIGYSACHWCHVMEHESFEDEELAGIMNRHFISIKVDREERSDVDMVYMQAVQLMTGQGGWPLNCFVMPDGKPFYGGTYFNKKQWKNVLLSIAELWENQPQKVEEYAHSLTEGIHQSETLVTTRKSESGLNRSAVISSVEKWKTRFDNELGGPNRAPKFPLPNNYLFLLRYALLQDDHSVLDYVHLTLQKMACGGIYDQLRGGFARYSTDMEWKVPHFEKMLYDNSQLVSLYCEAWQHSQNPLYKEVVEQTLDFVEKEWLGGKGNFYSAYDADSEGEEGKYYVWNKEELEQVLGDDFGIFSEYYHIDETGYWEHGNYILMRRNELPSQTKLDGGSEEFERIIEKCKAKLLEVAENRVKPGLDDKTITSWNAMMCSAYARAWMTFGNENYRKIALKSFKFIDERLLKGNELLHTYKKGVSRINGFLDDYVFFIEALLNVYLLTQDEKHLHKAKSLIDFCLEEFNNPESDLLFYTSASSSDLISRSSEVQDNVIPASNSQMALNLFYLSHYFGDDEYRNRAEAMLGRVIDEVKHYGSGYSNWACLALHLLWPFRQVAIVGNNVDENMIRLHQHGFTNAILAVGRGHSELPLLKNRLVQDKTMIYVCKDYSCDLPVSSMEEALKQF